MTFSLSLDEYLEGHRTYVRSQSRFLATVTPFFLGAMLLLFGVAFWMKRDPVAGGLFVFSLGALLFDHVWTPWRRRVKFRRDCGGASVTPPITYDFKPEGFVLRTQRSDHRFVWSDIERRIEGQNVWLFVVKSHKKYFLVLPKHALQTPEGAREWAVVDAHFAPPFSPPIASP